jgi:hypothetical protein
MSGEIRRATGLNPHGVKDSANMWRTFNGEHFNHWMVGPTRAQIAAYRAAGVRCRHVRSIARQIDDLFVHHADEELAAQVDATPSAQRASQERSDG